MLFQVHTTIRDPENKTSGETKAMEIEDGQASTSGLEKRSELNKLPETNKQKTSIFRNDWLNNPEFQNWLVESRISNKKSIL